MAVAASGLLESMADTDAIKCKASGILCVFGLSLGYESLYRSQLRAWQTARAHFRFYVSRINYHTVAICWIIPLALSFIPWSYYRKIAAFRTQVLHLSFLHLRINFVLNSIFFYLGVLWAVLVEWHWTKQLWA